MQCAAGVIALTSGWAEDSVQHKDLLQENQDKQEGLVVVDQKQQEVIQGEQEIHLQ